MIAGKEAKSQCARSGAPGAAMYLYAKKCVVYAMVCKQHRYEQKRFWFCQERQFVMPVSEKQIMPVTGEIPMDT